MNKLEDNHGLKALALESEGLSTVEYIILLVLIAIVGIGAWQAFGNRVRSVVGHGTTQVNGLDSTAASPPAAP
jgi:Flp pilus assembly pilin Flp